MGPASSTQSSAIPIGVTESNLWADFSHAQSTDEVCQSWLAIQCRHISQVHGGLVLIRSEDGNFAPVAVWPDVRKDMSYLSAAAQQCITDQRGVAVPESENSGKPNPNWHIAYPIQMKGDTRAIVVLDLAGRSDSELQGALRLLHWGSSWLNGMFLQRELDAAETKVRQSGKLFQICASFLREERFSAACFSVVNELANRLNCTRVSLGVERKGSVIVRAISNTAEFDKRTVLVSSIGKAMDEAFDQRRSIVAPEQPEREPTINLAHAEMVRDQQAGTIVSVPLLLTGRPVGSITLERADGREFDDETIRLAETLGEFLGPLVEEKRKNDRWIGAKIADSAADLAGKYLGPGHLTLKFFTLLGFVVLLFFSLATVQFRVSADTLVEGKMQRAAAAPFEAFIKESAFRAGENVPAGTVLALLDDRELNVERTKLTAELEQHRRKYRDAMAQNDRAGMRVIDAQMEQVMAQTQAIEDKLRQCKIVAPFDGVIVSGDLSQKIGTRVELGQVLFEIAPLSAYRVILKVDERDIHEVKVGQGGVLTLSGIANERLSFTVNKITSMSTAEEGRNYFPVEANLEKAHARIRPGMEGVGKIEIEKRKLIWIWSRRLINWIQLVWWEWTP